MLNSLTVFSAELRSSVNDNRITVEIEFAHNMEIMEKYSDNNKIAIKLSGNEEFKEEEFWGLQLSKVYPKMIDNSSMLVIFEFINNAPKFEIAKKGNAIVTTFILTSKSVEPQKKSGNVYVRMIFGIILILLLIFLFYGFMKSFVKKGSFSEIPGAGRSLGKVDIMPGRSLLFYELGNVVYMLGISSDSINLLDKITSTEEIDNIKSGFSKKKDFSSYFRFFGENELKDNVDVSSVVIQDKVDSLKRK